MSPFKIISLSLVCIKEEFIRKGTYVIVKQIYRKMIRESKALHELRLIQATKVQKMNVSVICIAKRKRKYMPTF